jgi:hypothetical protein
MMVNTNISWTMQQHQDKFMGHSRQQTRKKKQESNLCPQQILFRL